MKKLLPALFLALTAAPAIAQPQAAAPQPAEPRLDLRPIQPANALEHAFVSALDNPAMRPAFRRQLLDSHVAIALASSAPDAAPLELDLREGATAGLIFTSAARLDLVLGPAAPRAIMTGRAALERLRGKNVIVNMRLMPMLTLEPADIERYLETPESPSSAGPTQ